MELCIDDIVNFIIENTRYFDKDMIANYIKKHLEYGTCDYLTDNEGNLMYVSRWNVNGRTAHILDFIVAEKYRNRVNKLFKFSLTRGLLRFPGVRLLSWERETKYPNRKQRLYSVYQMLKGGSNGR